MSKLRFAKRTPSKREYLKKEINLLPEDLGQRKKKYTRNFIYFLALAIFIGSMAGGYIYLDLTMKEKVAEKTKLENSIMALTEKENDQGLILYLNSRVEAKSKAIMEFELISPKIIPVLNSLENNMPAKLSFTSLGKDETGLMIEGEASSQEVIAELLHNLKNEDLFESVVVETISTNSLENNQGFYFTMQCQFKNMGGDDDVSI